jgi:hypothetical protein
MGKAAKDNDLCISINPAVITLDSSLFFAGCPFIGICLAVRVLKGETVNCRTQDGLPTPGP